jgi:hypothetical protein
MALAGRIAAFIGGQYSTNDRLYAHSVSSRGWRYVRSRVPLAVQRRAACTIQVTYLYYSDVITEDTLYSTTCSLLTMVARLLANKAVRVLMLMLIRATSEFHVSSCLQQLHTVLSAT